MVTIKDVAEKSGYSKSTVSKVLNGYNEIGEDAKDKIMQVADQLGYLSNYHARALKMKKTYSIGVVYFDSARNGLKNDFFAWLIHNFREGVEKEGYDLTFINASVGADKKTYLEHAIYRAFDGVCIICADGGDPEIVELAENDEFPVVAIDMDFAKAKIVKSDNYDGIKKLVEYIISRNHKKIAYVTGHDSWVTQPRLKAYYDVMLQNGLKVPEEYVIESYYRDPADTEKQVSRLLKLKDRPTCILVPDDFALLGAIKAINEAGLSYPEDVSLAGYDGIPMAKIISPAITTIEQDSYNLGLKAAEKLINSIDGIEEERITIVKGRLIEGESVYKLRNDK